MVCVYVCVGGRREGGRGMKEKGRGKGRRRVGGRKGGGRIKDAGASSYTLECCSDHSSVTREL